GGVAGLAAVYAGRAEASRVGTGGGAGGRPRASVSPARERLDSWLASFCEQWRLRHPHVKFVRLGTAPGEVWLDETAAVGQILTILLDNAARASCDRVTLAAAVADGFIEFEVCDSGPGISPALRTKLGSAPVDSTQGGHGVGLYLAFAAASRLNGSIELFDGEPRGTRVVLRVPAAKDDGQPRRGESTLSNTKENEL
ncbi:sensor histidine kinase, partial [Trinickia sp.]|uniref:sensor histidine kinase n=1 Tax=Trinickia sp. TaxID=2571163 RepID=UPI003F7EB8C2